MRGKGTLFLQVLLSIQLHKRTTEGKNRRRGGGLGRAVMAGLEDAQRSLTCS